MTAWNTAEAQNHFTELLQAVRTEPQMLCTENKTVAVMMDVHLFRKLIGKNPDIPSMAELMAELELIRDEEPIDIDIPERMNRPNPISEEH